MKCPNCYCEVKENDVFCKNCGQELNNDQKSVVNFNNPVYKRRNSHPWIIVACVVFVLIAAFVAFIMYCIKSDEEKVSKGNNSKEVQTDRREKEKTNQVDFNGYTFKIPAKFTSNPSDDKLFVYGEKNEWVAVVMVKELKYDTIAQSKDQLKTLLANQAGASNYDMSEATTEEKEYGGKQFLITKNIKSDSYNLDISYGKIDDNNISIISITKSNGSELLETERAEIYKMFATAKKGA